MVGYEQGLSRPSSPTVKDRLTVVDYPLELRASLPERNNFGGRSRHRVPEHSFAKVLALAAALWLAAAAIRRSRNIARPARAGGGVAAQAALACPISGQVGADADRDIPSGGRRAVSAGRDQSRIGSERVKARGLHAAGLSHGVGIFREARLRRGGSAASRTRRNRRTVSGDEQQRRRLRQCGLSRFGKRHCRQHPGRDRLSRDAAFREEERCDRRRTIGRRMGFACACQPQSAQREGRHQFRRRARRTRSRTGRTTIARRRN